MRVSQDYLPALLAADYSGKFAGQEAVIVHPGRWDAARLREEAGCFSPEPKSNKP
jgi:hypothetical protein